VPRLTAIVVVLAALAAACSHHSEGIPTPKPTLPTTTTEFIDYTNVSIHAVPGRTTTTIDRSPGKANLAGVVAAPDGVVPGATVRVQRLVADAVVQTDVPTAPDGRWSLPNVKGGRYRVRAFRAPDLAETDAQVFFLGGTETRTLTLRVDRFGGIQVTSAMAPTPPAVGTAVNLVVQVTADTVDNQGVVRSQPQAGALIQLYGPGNWRVESANPQPANGAGRVQWTLRCQGEGNQALSVTIGGGPAYALQVAPCEPASSTTEPESTTTTSA